MKLNLHLKMHSIKIILELQVVKNKNVLKEPSFNFLWRILSFALTLSRQIAQIYIFQALFTL